MGAMFGEAMVINQQSLNHDFRYMIKHHGGLLAKGRLLGIQFATLFENDIYFKISKVAVSQAMKIRKALEKKGYELYYDSYTNQQFVILDNEKLKELERDFSFFKWMKVDNKTVIRIVTSWATTEEDVDKLIEEL